jgi:hypothetical protein
LPDRPQRCGAFVPLIQLHICNVNGESRLE